MDEKTLRSRLSAISTVWTALRQAHGTTDEDAASAHEALIQRYQGAVYRYLLGATHDSELADELFQESARFFSERAISSLNS